MMADSDTISSTGNRLAQAMQRRTRFSSDTEGLRLATRSTFHSERVSGDAIWFSFFLFQLTNSFEDIRAAHPTSDTFGSRFHNVALVQEHEQFARERRRSLLIHRKHRGRLTEAEAIELERLQVESEAELAAALNAPLEELRKLADEQ